MLYVNLNNVCCGSNGNYKSDSLITMPAIKNHCTTGFGVFALRQVQAGLNS